MGLNDRRSSAASDFSSQQLAFLGQSVIGRSGLDELEESATN